VVGERGTNTRTTRIRRMSGHYIAFEGIEGAGKSTVSDAVARRIVSDHGSVVQVREPGGTKLGEGIRQLLLSPEYHVVPWAEAMLFSANRAQLTAEVVAPALEAGRWVLSDRTVFSSMAYQGGGRSLGVTEVTDVNAPGLAVWPDLVILLDVDPERGLTRQHDADRIGSEGVEFQTKVRQTFLDVAEQRDDVIVIDANRAIQDVLDDVFVAIDSRCS